MDRLRRRTCGRPQTPLISRFSGNARSERIRTSDPLLPKQVRYQAALRSDTTGVIDERWRVRKRIRPADRTNGSDKRIGPADRVNGRICLDGQARAARMTKMRKGTGNHPSTVLRSRANDSRADPKVVNASARSSPAPLPPLMATPPAWRLPICFCAPLMVKPSL